MFQTRDLSNRRAESMFAMIRCMPASPPFPLLVACLCAEWCATCREYRGTFDRVAAEFPDVRFLWVDIEDEADRVDLVEVENFPTLLIARGAQARFFGPLTPHKATLVRLLRAEIEGSTAADLTDPALPALIARLRQFAR